MTYIAEMPSKGAVVENRYHLVEALGQGSYGVVFRARDDETGDDVAIKIIRPLALEQHKVIQRFTQEIHVAQRLDHPNTVRVLRHGVHGSSAEVQGLPFLVMELLEGRNLRQHLDRVTRLSLDEAAAVLLEVLDGLRQAHDLGIIHRDLKLENIFLARHHEHPSQIKLLDFGTVKALSNEAERLTQTDMVMGTPQIMAPEQITGQRDLTTAVDVYAVGCLAIHLLSGEPAFKGRTQLEVASQHLNKPPPPLPDGLDATPLGEVVRKALAKRAGERWLNATAMRDALRGALDAMHVEPAMPDLEGRPRPAPRTPPPPLPPPPDPEIDADFIALDDEPRAPEAPPKGKLPLVAVAVAAILLLALAAILIAVLAS